MTWYHAAHGTQAGPFTEEQFRALVADGTIQPSTLVWESRLPNWLPFAQVPPEVFPPTAPSTPPILSGGAAGVVCSECRQTFPPDQIIQLAGRNVCGDCKPLLVQRLSEGATLAAPAPTTLVTPEQLLQREFRVDIGHALERGWKAISTNLGPTILSSLLFVLMIGAVGGVFGVIVGIGVGGAVGPRGGAAPSAVTWVVIGVSALVLILLVVVGSALITAGYSYFYLNIVRHGQANYGHIFEGFRRKFGALLGAWFIQTMISVAITAPFSLLNHFMVMGKANPVLLLLVAGLSQFVSIAASIYLATIWFFASLLILDKGLGCWKAMTLSRKAVSRRFWMMVLFVVVAMIVAFAGVVACGIGLLISVPLMLAMKAAVYEENFADLQPATD